MKTLLLLIALVTTLGIHRSVAGCTIFMATRGDRVLVGNNEDWTNPETRMWVVPAGKSRFGVLFFGFDDGFPQGGMNERGLFFDGAALPLKEEAAEAGKPKANASVLHDMMRRCATVQEALVFLARYDLAPLARAQLLLADRTGDSAIVERNHVIRRRGEYQIATNFRHSRFGADQISCERYRTADRMLGEGNEISVELFRTILDATHQEGPSSTLYSNIYDLKSGEIYLYREHDFARVVKIRLSEVLAKGKHRISLRSLFGRRNRGRSPGLSMAHRR